jgi:putative selenium metabolism protein SsnA
MLITHGHIVTWGKPNEILEDYSIHIVDGIVDDLGPTSVLESSYSSDEHYNARGQYIFPGNICAHTHFYGAYARGMSLAGSQPENFPEILEKLWWRLDRALDEKAVYYSAMVCLIDAIKHGTTTLIDHHASPNAITGSLDQIARAVIESGTRAVLCYEVTDRGGWEQTEAGIDENMRFIQLTRERSENRGRLGAMFGLHASLTLSENTLNLCREAGGRDVGYHIHVAESSVDEYDSLEKCGMRVVDRLEKHGLLGPDSIAVHGVHVDSKEIEILSRTGTWVTHQPRSNMNNGVGIPRVEEMLRSGVKVCLGNDGFSNSMWEEWKTAYLVHKHQYLDPRRMNGDDVIEMAVYNNAKLASRLLGGIELGVIKIGAAADFILVDYKPFTPLTAGNVPWHILFGFRDSMVTSTIVNGRFLMRDRQIMVLDEASLLDEACEYASIVWNRYQNI